MFLLVVDNCIKQVEEDAMLYHAEKERVATELGAMKVRVFES